MATRDPILADLFFIRRGAPCIVRALDIDHASQTPKREIDIVAAAQLFILCPRELWERCQAGDSMEWVDKNDVAGTHLWGQDMRKFSVERWEHWKIRWQNIRDAPGASSEIKTVASQAVEAMHSVV
jgi:hypothetical protein